MADFNVNHITNKNGDQGPTIAGVTTVSSTGAMKIPSGATNYGQILKEDPYYEFLSVALPFYGPEGSQVFTDRSKYGDNWTVNGDTQYKSDQSKFYGTSAYFDKDNDYLYSTNVYAYEPGARFSTVKSDWTWETWFYKNGNTTDTLSLLTDNTVDQVSNGYFGKYINIQQNKLNMSMQRNNGADLSYVFINDLTSQYAGAPSVAFDYDEWVHFAISYDSYSQAFRAFLNGELKSTCCFRGGGAGLTPDQIDGYTKSGYGRKDMRAGRIYIGATHSGVYDLYGWLNDYRYYVGVCKYKKSFTPPPQIAF